MRVSEARWIAQQLADIPLEKRSPVVNIGSSTEVFRTVNQPHIDRIIFAPLVAAGVKVIHTDLKMAPGVDVAGDLGDPNVRRALRAYNPWVAICSNLLEHVTEPSLFAAHVQDVVQPGGYVIVTVPRSYPFHADPIDTGYRPDPEQLAGLFPGTVRIVAQVVADTTYLQELRSLGLNGLRKGIKDVVGAVTANGDVARHRRDKMRWLNKPFTTSCVMLQVHV
jgi:hypothetical protein